MKKRFSLILALWLLLVFVFPVGAQATTVSSVTIVQDYVRIRTQATTASVILATVMTGTTYPYLATTEKDSSGYAWYQLQFTLNQVGFVRSDLARLNQTSPDTALGEVVVHSAIGLNVRTGPSVNYPQIGRLPDGAILSYYGQNSGWYKIWYNSQYTWISGAYATPKTGTGTFTPSTPLGKLVIRSADGLNVRTGPSVNYTLLGTLANGSVHPYYGTQSGWYKIVYQNQYAWISGYYVSLDGASPPVTPVNRKYIAITFDDGPSIYTPGLLNGLQARNVKATFFVVGYNVDYYPATVRRINNEGHEVANHTNGHYNLPSYSYGTILSQITRLDAKISNLIGKTPRFLRPPYGAMSTRVMNAAAEAGKAVITWSVDPRDWETRVASTVTSRIVNNAFAGAIILVHDLYPTSIKGALAAIDQLKARGYTFVTLSDLFAVYGKKPVAGVRYSSLKY